MTLEWSTLKDRLRDTYRQISSDGGPTEEEIRSALATLAGAWDQVAASFSTALNDPETRAHLKEAASSAAAALGATLSSLGEELRGRGEIDDEPADLYE